MKKFLAGFLALSVLTASSCALADTVLSGTITSSRTEVVYAPYGGQIVNLSVSEGDIINVGDPIADIKPTGVYAPMAGTVTAVFAEPGDAADSIEERYSAILYLESGSRYTVSASTARAYASSSTRDVHIGETVYLACTADGSHVGSGTIITVGDADDEGNISYTLEVKTGTMLIGETVKICRTFDMAAETCIGRGTVGQAKPVAVKGSGSILRLSVKTGDVVERGELLFETVDGSLDGLYAPDNHIVSSVSGIVAKTELEEGGTVSQNGVMVSVYPLDALQAQVSIPVLDLSNYAVGQKATIEVDLGGEDVLLYEGTVARISHAIASDDTKNKTVKAWIDFDADESVVYGMPVTVNFVSLTGTNE